MMSDHPGSANPSGTRCWGCQHGSDAGHGTDRRCRWASLERTGWGSLRRASCPTDSRASAHCGLTGCSRRMDTSNSRMPIGIGDRVRSGFAINAEGLAVEPGAHRLAPSCLSHCASAISRAPRRIRANNARGIMVFHITKSLLLPGLKCSFHRAPSESARLDSPSSQDHRAILLRRQNLAISMLEKHMAR
jgi:hypothetical protein